MSEFKDKSGRSVSVGDLIVYAVSYGRSPGLSYGLVLGITENKKLKVIGCDTDNFQNEKFRMNSKPSFLMYKDRVLVVDSKQVPQSILVALSGWTQ